MQDYESIFTALARNFFSFFLFFQAPGAVALGRNAVLVLADTGCGCVAL